MAKWAKCWDAIYSGLRFNQRSYIDAYIVPWFLDGFKNIFAPFRILRKKKKKGKKEREKEKIVIPKSESNKSPRRIPD